MDDFKRYMHIERFGTDEVEGIELGEVYIFPKLDGTNASIWCGKDENEIHCGSRRREICIDKDNHGFAAHVASYPRYKEWFRDYPDTILYGEYLVPHSLKTYHDHSWNHFYVFDVWNKYDEKYIPFTEKFTCDLATHGIFYVPVLSIIQNPSYEQLIEQTKKNTFLIKDGEGYGEGIVLKNYNYENKYGRTVWAKIVTNEFKDKHLKEMRTPKLKGPEMVEQGIVDKYCTSALVEKTYAKIVNEENGWKNQYIPRLLNTVYHDLVTEDIWDAVKKFKDPSINFRILKSMVTMKIKEIKKELF